VGGRYPGRRGGRTGVNGGSNMSRLDVFVGAGETWGDVRGAGLREALTRLHGGTISFRGVGGPRMIEAGLASLFPAHDLTGIGPAAVIRKLPTLARRLYQTVDTNVPA